MTTLLQITTFTRALGAAGGLPMLRQLAAFLAVACLTAPLGCGSGQKNAPRPTDPVAQPAPAPASDGPQVVGSIPAMPVAPGTDPAAKPADPPQVEPAPGPIE